MTQYPDGLDQLQERVKAAALELNRLKSDNEQLSETLKDIWDEKQDDDGTAIVLEEDRDTLRQQVKDYIATIDRFLQEEQQD